MLLSADIKNGLWFRLSRKKQGVADPTLEIHSKPPLPLHRPTGLHLDLIHGGVEALDIPPLLGGKEACRLRPGHGAGPVE